MATTYKWQFAPRFRRNAFGWQSDTPMLRIKEALAEIKSVAKKEPILAAEGAVRLLEKLSPAIAQVDSSSGAIGSAVNRAIETLVPIIVKADVTAAARQAWLVRLWQALQEDEIPYIESLGEYWGELCAHPDSAATWADTLKSGLETAWADDSPGGRQFFRGTTACLSALYAAGRHDELLALLEKAPFPWWSDRRWGAKVLLGQGKRAEAIRYAEACKGINALDAAIAEFCEEVLLASGFADEAYARYAIAATYASTNLATFKAIAKKYPNQAAETILRDLVASQPGQEGKWFAAAKDAGLFDLAIELANSSPANPRTLTRAARDYSTKQPGFAMAAATTALQGIVRGYGYEITGTDVLDAYTALMQAAAAAGVEPAAVKASLRAMTADAGKPGLFVQKVLARQLAG